MNSGIEEHLASLYCGFTIVGLWEQDLRNLKKMSLVKKLTLASSLAIGIDSIITPLLTNGQSFHEMMGLSAGDYEPIIKYSEIVLAQITPFYLNKKLVTGWYKEHQKEKITSD